MPGGYTVADKRVDFSYLRDGRFSAITRYESLGTTEFVGQSHFDYDTTGRLKTLRHRSGMTTFADYGFTYDAANRLTGFTNVKYPGESVTYAYDDRGQVTGANYTTQTDETYQWDDNGNRNNGGFTPGVNNQLTSDGTYTYVHDNEGNLTKRTKISGTDPDGTKTREFAWDHRNRLVKVTHKNTSNGEINRIEYAYDGDDHMIRRQVFLGGSGTPSLQQVFAYSDGQITLQFEKAGGGALTRTDLARRYLWGPAVDELLADEDINSLTNAALNTVLWPLTDHLGTVRDWVNNSAAVVDHVEYDSFGKRLDTPAIDAAFGWTGRYRDPVTGLQYNNARWYDPSTQHWLSEDPIGIDGQDGNLYRYVKNAPTLYVDPSGLYPPESVMDDRLGIGPRYQNPSPSPRPNGGQGRLIPPGGYMSSVGDVIKGYGDAAVGTTKGIAFIIRHPIQTAKGVGTGVAHPIVTGKTIWNDLCHKSETVRGQGELVGDFLIGLATGGAMKAASKSATVVKTTQRLEGAAEKSALVARIMAKINLYPKIVDPRTGRHIPFPAGIQGRVPKADRVAELTKAQRQAFKDEWCRRGYEVPTGGWENYDFHHIQPREFGGTHDFWNLVPVERRTHQQHFNKFWREFEEM